MRPGEIEFNALIRLQEELKQQSTPQSYDRVVSKHAAEQAPPINTVIQQNTMRKHSHQWQALLETISDYLIEGEATWWRKLSNGDIEFFDVKMPANQDIPSNPGKQHFRSSKTSTVHTYLQSKSMDCVNKKVTLPAVTIHHYNLHEEESENEGTTTQHESESDELEHFNTTITIAMKEAEAEPFELDDMEVTTNENRTSDDESESDELERFDTTITVEMKEAEAEPFELDDIEVTTDENRTSDDESESDELERFDTTITVAMKEAEAEPFELDDMEVATNENRTSDQDSCTTPKIPLLATPLNIQTCDAASHEPNTCDAASHEHTPVRRERNLKVCRLNMKSSDSEYTFRTKTGIMLSKLFGKRHRTIIDLAKAKAAYKQQPQSQFLKRKYLEFESSTSTIVLKIYRECDSKIKEWEQAFISQNKRFPMKEDIYENRQIGHTYKEKRIAKEILLSWNITIHL